LDRLHDEIGYVIPMLFFQCCTMIAFDISDLPERRYILGAKTVETSASQILDA
jgi:hypothetical protein